jgi:succinate dehydrogenase flavin-adding protein (antitoxin of CptAB toxin-antitoxin module)
MRRRAFERLLSATDPQLVAWLYRRERPDDPDVEAIVDELLAGGR